MSGCKYQLLDWRSRRRSYFWVVWQAVAKSGMVAGGGGLAMVAVMVMIVVVKILAHLVHLVDRWLLVAVMVVVTVATVGGWW